MSSVQKLILNPFQISFLKMLKSLRFFILTVFILSGCSKDNLPEFNRLETLRVVTLISSQPEVNPGDTVTITPVVSDVRATSLKYSVSVCLDPGVSVGAEPTCEGSLSQIILATDVALVQPTLAESWTGLADTFNVSIPSEAIIFAGRSTLERYNGVSYLLQYTLSNDLGEKVKAIKRIVVSETSKTSKNLNPVTSDILANGVSLVTLTPGSTVELTTNLTASSAEAYFLQSATGLENHNENLVTTWFVTDGTTKFYRSEGLSSNSYEVSGPPAGRSSYILAVTKDDRGGVSVVKKKF